MEAFRMEIAGMVFCLQPLFQSTREYCKAYLTDKTPDAHVTVTREDLAFEQMMLEREAVEEGLKIRKFSDQFLERASMQRQIADRLIRRNTIMLHGSTVSLDGKAYLFTAPCGTGKSTHTGLWRELFGQRAVMVNDDKPFLQITDSGVLAYGSPWSGKHGLASNLCVPLRGICFLRRGKENVINRITSEQVLEMLYHQAHIPEDDSLAEVACSLVDRVAQQVPLWEMYCNKELEAARIAYGAMSGCDL